MQEAVAAERTLWEDKLAREVQYAAETAAQLQKTRDHAMEVR